ncbi:MAG: pentapeptide repeat-containing protein [Symploca sp. SIO2B6]|nr:pentapeptide repeat-containing protein [Symploca sp. SIO2B6]
MTGADIRDFFIEPNANLEKGHPELRFMATLDRKQLVDRWQQPKGREIFSRWKSENYSRSVLDSLVGKFYGQTDLRGITLVNEILSDTDLSYCDMFASNLQGAKFERTPLDHTYLSETNIKGTCFDYCFMNDVLIDNAKFNVKTSFIGVDLNRINFNLAWALKTHALNQQKIFDYDRRYPIFSKFLFVTCDYGRSFVRFFIWCAGIVILFAFIYHLLDLLTFQGFWNNLYGSVMIFTTLATEVQTVSLLGKFFVAIEACIGYVMGGLLIGILAKRIMID